jgi:hypothetical protein
MMNGQSAMRRSTSASSPQLLDHPPFPIFFPTTMRLTMSAMNRSQFMIALQVIAACSLLPLLGLPAAELPQTTNRMAGRHFVFNVDSNDYDYAATPGRAQAWMRAQYRRIVSAGADVLIADVALPDVVETKDTPTGEIIGARLSSKRYKTVAELSAQCTDTLRIACDEGHRKGALVLAGMRMSDAHHGTEWKPASDSELFGKFTMEHPEWCNTWPDGRKEIVYHLFCKSLSLARGC